LRAWGRRLPQEHRPPLDTRREGPGDDSGTARPAFSFCAPAVNEILPKAVNAA